MSDKDKRARYDRGEIDEDGNPKMPFGSGGFGGGYGGGGAAPRPGAGAGFEGFDAAGAADLSDLFEGLFGAAGARRGGGGFGGRNRAPRKGDDVAYRLKFRYDAATLNPARDPGERATVDVKLPKGSKAGRAFALPGRASPGPPGRAMPSSPSRSPGTHSMVAKARIFACRCR